MKIKYPRTYHLPWSEERSKDDKSFSNLDSFANQEVIVSIKYDGECSSLYSDGTIHARSLDSSNHEWQSWLKNFWVERSYLLPSGWRVCGENLYAAHSIFYNNLNSYFYGFSIWNEDTCLSWQETLEWFEYLEIKPVEVLYQGLFNEKLLKEIYYSLDKKHHEGYVVRVAGSFSYNDFSKYVGKVVRKGHVQTNQHWVRNWQKNKLGDGYESI